MANGEYGDIGLRVRQRREELGLTRENGGAGRFVRSVYGFR